MSQNEIEIYSNQVYSHDQIHLFEKYVGKCMISAHKQ